MKAGLTSILVVILLRASITHAQETPTKMGDMPGMEMPSAEVILRSAPSSLLPQIGQPDHGQTPIYELADLEAKALLKNPTIAQSQAALRSADGRKLQAGLWPNPTVGYLGDEIAGGRGVNGGRQGGFVEQTIVLGHKLYLAAQVAGADVRIAALEKEEQRYRVQNAIRSAYFQTVAAQESLALAKQYVKLAALTLQTTQQLRNAGARDDSEVAMAEIELERAKLGAETQESHLQEEWENLRNVAGDPSLPTGFLAGKLDTDLPQIDKERLVNAIVEESPAIKIAHENVTRAEASVQEARRQPVPDLHVRAGLEQNLEQNDLTGKPYGLEGFAEVRVELPIFNRNQGNVSAARAEIELSHADTRRLELQLRQQAAIVVEQYEVARTTVDRYRTEILPRTHRLYEMQLKAWGRMALSYPQVLVAEQSLFTTQAEYIHALENLHTNAVALSGFLQTEGLGAPGAR